MRKHLVWIASKKYSENSLCSAVKAHYGSSGRASPEQHRERGSGSGGVESKQKTQKWSKSLVIVWSSNEGSSPTCVKCWSASKCTDDTSLVNVYFPTMSFFLAMNGKTSSFLHLSHFGKHLTCEILCEQFRPHFDIKLFIPRSGQFHVLFTRLITADGGAWEFYMPSGPETIERYSPPCQLPFLLRLRLYSANLGCIILRTAGERGTCVEKLNELWIVGR